MALPQNVRKAAREAERLHAAAYSEQPASPSEPGSTPAPTSSEPPPTPTNPSVPPPEPPPAAAEETPEQIIARMQRDLETERQRNAVLQGKYNAELPRERERAQMLENLLASVTQRQAESQPVTPETPPEMRPQSLLTDEDKEAFGDDFIDFTRRAAREVVGQELQRFSEQLDEIKQSVQGARQQAGMTAEQMTQQQLDALCPRWRELNNDQGFLDWLKVRDIYAGEFRNTLIKQAYTAHDAARVAAFFNTYLQETQTVTPQPQPASAPAFADTPKASLESLAAPGTGKPSTAPAAPDKKVWTPTLISQFYAQVQRGHFRGRDADRRKIEADIFAAQREGRFRPS